MVLPAAAKHVMATHVLFPLFEDLLSGQTQLDSAFEISGAYKHQAFLIGGKLIDSRKIVVETIRPKILEEVYMPDGILIQARRNEPKVSQFF